MRLHRCPDTAHMPPPYHGPLYVVGCGAVFPAEPDREGLIDCPECGMWFPPAATVKVCVGTKRGRNYGLVYDGETEAVIGRVFRASKVARKSHGGGRRSFWTAHGIVDDAETTCSLGTRHVERRDAVAAILAFHASYPREAIIAAAQRIERGARARPTSGGALRWALGCAAVQFKYDHHEVCGLAVRNLPNPRESRWHVTVQAAR